MKRSVFSAAALLVALSGALLGQPVLSSISPTQTTAGAPAFTMTLNGTGFVGGIVTVNFRGNVLIPLTSASTQITVQITSALLAVPGNVDVSVTLTPANQAPVTSGSRTFTINSPPVITTTTLNAMTVGVAFSQTLAASLGTPPYGNWHVVEGVLPAGLSLNANTGVIGGTPTAAGSDMVQISVEDNAGVSASTVFGWTVNPVPLTITTNSLPNATAGSAYSQAFAAIGGVSPYTWSVALGTLQPGLSLSAAGVLSGTPTQGGTSNFTVRVADAQGSIATKVFTLTVTVPSATLSITGKELTDIVSPALQPAFDVQLSAAYPLTITGTMTLTFRQNAIYPSDDPAIQFSGGGRTLNFTIPAGQLSAFPTNPPSVQTGTVAGQIDLTVISLFAGGQNITPANPPVRSMTIARLAPKINSVQVVKVGGGFNIVVTGYSTPRQVIQADFTFTPAAGAKLQTTPVTVIVESVFIIWYTGTTSPLYGSQFLYTQPFTVQGNVSDIASVSVTLAHSTGTSTAVSASF
jgi:hypothetical protein